MVDKEKVLAGRAVVDAHRKAHHALHSKSWHWGIPEEHTPLLEKMVVGLEQVGYTSTATELGEKSSEMLAKLVHDSDLLSLQELGFVDAEDWHNRATEADREAMRLRWR